MQCLENAETMTRPVGNGVICGSDLDDRCKNWSPVANQSYRGLRDGPLNAAFPGILCMACLVHPYGQVSRTDAAA
jgi:hypothetical protein